jgi:hypothetical protein
VSRIKQYSLDLLAISEKPWSMAWQPTSYRHKFSYWSQEMIIVNSIINFLPFTQTTDHLFTHALKHRGNYTCRLLQRITFQLFNHAVYLYVLCKILKKSYYWPDHKHLDVLCNGETMCLLYNGKQIFIFCMD